MCNNVWSEYVYRYGVWYLLLLMEYILSSHRTGEIMCVRDALGVVCIGVKCVGHSKIGFNVVDEFNSKPRQQNFLCKTL